MKPALLLCVCLAFAAAAAASEPAADEIDHLELAALLIRDGHHDRAESVLRQVDPARPGLDLARYHLLLGLLKLKAADFQAAALELQQSLRLDPSQSTAWLSLAQAHFGRGECAQTLAALERAGHPAADVAAAWLMRGRCHLRQRQWIQALEALEGGLALHARAMELQHQKVLLFVGLGLYQQAQQEGALLLAQPRAGEADFLALAEALRQGGQHRRAIELLEQARLRFGEGREVLRQLARSYLDAKLPLSAAELLGRAGWSSPELLVEAAELYRRAGHRHRALLLNAQVADQKQKMRQRLALLIELGRFEEAAAMRPALSRLELLGEDKVAYALAYAMYRVGDFERAREQVRGLTDPVVFSKSIELLRAIEVCKKTVHECE